MPATVSREPSRSRQFWLGHVQRCKDSGLSKAAYCQQHQLKANSFYNWSSKLSASAPGERESRQTLAPPPLEFVAVNVRACEIADGPVVRVQRSGTEVALPCNLSSEQIHHWLSAIHQLDV